MAVDDGQGQVYTAFIRGYLDREYDRREYFDRRIRDVHTTSAAVLALLGAGAAFALGKDVKIGAWASLAFAGALAGLIAAATLAAWASQLGRYRVADAATLRRMLTGHWGDDAVDARNVCATAEIATIESLQAINETEANRLQWAIRVQIGAFALLAVGLVLAVVAV